MSENTLYFDKDNLRDTIDGCLNRMSISDDIEEVLQLYDGLQSYSKHYFKACMKCTFGKSQNK